MVGMYSPEVLHTAAYKRYGRCRCHTIKKCIRCSNIIRLMGCDWRAAGVWQCSNLGEMDVDDALHLREGMKLGSCSVNR